MDLDEFHKDALRTNNPSHSPGKNVLESALGLSSEAGELAQIVRKVYFEEVGWTPHEHNKCIEEAGDILRYLCKFCDAIGTSLEEIAEKNVQKMKQRMPNGFDKVDYYNRTYMR